MIRGRIFLYGLTLFLLTGWHGATADIAWFNSSTNRVFYNDGITPLFGFKGNSAISSFVQLLYAGANNLIDPAWAEGDGAHGDDVVVAWSYIGYNVPGAEGSTSHYGRVVGDVYGDEVANGLYYVRVWNTPSPDFDNGLIPLSPTSYYGNSVLFLALAGFDPPATPQDFNFGGADGFSTTLLPIPEPNLMTAALGSLLVWACLLRRRRSPGA
jgi:hypothetical protein